VGCGRRNVGTRKKSENLFCDRRAAAFETSSFVRGERRSERRGMFSMRPEDDDEDDDDEGRVGPPCF